LNVPVSARLAAPYLLKALRLVKQNREIAMDAMMKFSEAGQRFAWCEKDSWNDLERTSV
jgi:hypothetical protein